MSHRLIWLCLVAPTILAASSFGVSPAAARDPQLPPCPPRERGVPKPDNCYDPCPSDMVGEHPNCTCPPGTKKAERPERPGQHCVKIKSPPVQIEPNIRLKDLVKPCPEPRLGADCHCPPGLLEPNCKPPLLIPNKQLPIGQ